jgi:peptidoglycan hydrolase-like protein with peptidoglycan-binding domain
MMLFEGSSGLNVERLQRFLVVAGAYDGAVDGWFGPKTHRAVEAWQAHAGVKVDGLVGPETLRATSEQVVAANRDGTVIRRIGGFGDAGA